MFYNYKVWKEINEYDFESFKLYIYVDTLAVRIM